ncbi:MULTISPECIES: aromatic ring-hydroxylating dioxygenase subunit alpha [unclassified Beijerinckia]|uniref:aromatic ring-hydroxylating dioxygenase subunit alpha n=1 Tax=unclassified Beijerinckia TaxID=2638183 RepID=UPI000898091A|nr:MULTISPECIES: aromatic ring-hydroxylating dioxygenase subunit alpha [unclassified Beijerinckia]MDH7796899.1 anthranilate 1,2-dioxygenase large subunit [Beijerinckia sp. GAS462]SEC64371.1 terephthalate 1,2-dioxygenase, alpha subunit [Beijerinckia sp. 28-YEA-48]
MSQQAEIERSVEGMPNWSGDGFTRVPYWVFQRDDVYAREQEAIFQGPVWHYLCLEADIAEGGDFFTTFVGDAPVVVTRDGEGAIHAFENRCAHRGALICLDAKGKGKRDFACVYHAWTYDLTGKLTGVAFQKGVKGKGGMPPDFKISEHGPRRLTVTTLHGLVFGSFSADAPDFKSWLGPEIEPKIGRVLAGRKPVVLGRYTQVLPNNWKLYIENVKDSYHASILHLFFTTFELNRLSQKGAIVVDETGGHHISYSAVDRKANTAGGEYAQQKIRSDSQYKLADPSLLQGFNELGDDVTLQILSVFPTFVLQQIQNCIAIRQVVPRGPDRTDLHWTLLGFETDTPEQRLTRLKQANLVGPAGFISMEDGCVGGFVQRGVRAAPNEQAILQMGGSTVESSESRVTEASIRGFWKAWRAHTGI